MHIIAGIAFLAIVGLIFFYRVRKKGFHVAVKDEVNAQIDGVRMLFRVARYMLIAIGVFTVFVGFYILLNGGIDG